MKEEHDDIENFFNKYLDDRDFEYDEAHWEELEQKLNSSSGVDSNSTKSNDAVRLSRLKSTTALLGVGIAAFFLGWYLKENNIKYSTQELEIAKDIQSVESINPASSNQENSPLSVDDHQKNPTDGKAIEVSKDQQVLVSNLAKGTFKGDKTGSVNDQRQIGTSTDNSTIKQLTSVPPISDSQDNQITQTANVSNENLNVTPDDDMQKRSTLAMPASIKEIVRGSLAEIPLVVIEEDSASDEFSQVQESKSEWALTGFVAPDFNSTNFSELYESIGQGVGLKIEYSPNSIIRFGVGAVVNSKIYTANKGEYKPEAGFWTNGIAPESTNAKCITLDIPIHLGYKLFDSKKRSIWLNTGLSTYWLLSEKYQFQYANTNSDLVQRWSGSGENFHIFSSLNLSLSYEHLLNNKFSFIVDPYFKAPIKGIGHGSVNLLSSGVNIGIKYHLVKNKSEPPER